MSKAIASSYRHRLAAFAAITTLLVFAALPRTSHAANAPGGTSSASTGLRITPVRQFLAVDAGTSTSSSITMTNLSSQPLDVTISAQQFSVADYSYDYEFSSPTNDWLHLGETVVTLSPRASHAISYTVQPPTDALPGGHYYTIIASARVSANKTGSTIRAAQPVYVTVNGQLLRTGKVNNSSIPHVVFGRTIPYTLESVNTGNVHFFAYLNAKLDGMLTHRSATAGTHILMPDKPRQLTGSISSPVLPGLYKVTFGYKTDANESVSRSAWIIFIPPWFIALLLGTLLLAGKLLPRRRKQSKSN